MNRPKLLLLLRGLLACTGTFVAAGPTADVGTLAVSGLQGGIGGHLEIGKLWERERFALGAAVTGAVAGYSSTADADPVFLTGVEVRSKRCLGHEGPGVRPFLELGGGPVIAWVAGPQAGGLVAHLGAGFQGRRSNLQWWVALRARPMGLVGGQAGAKIRSAAGTWKGVARQGEAGSGHAEVTGAK
jgi:hypothetical protein